jgi:hypothetical protein
MKIPANVAVATAIAIMASPALAGGGSGRQAHGAPMHHQPQVHQGGQHGHSSRAPGHPDARGVPSQAHARFGGPRLDQRPDPNNQNPYRPMYSLGATNPGEPHPYFQTRKDGFGYPAAQPSPVYLGNGQYFIPR